MKNDIDTILDRMTRFGGSFVKSLASCYRHADQNNTQILLKSFEVYFKEYDAIQTFRDVGMY
jgi:hypothetical protein